MVLEANWPLKSMETGMSKQPKQAPKDSSFFASLGQLWALLLSFTSCASYDHLKAAWSQSPLNDGPFVNGLSTLAL